MASLTYVVDRDVICSRSHSKRYVFRFLVENHFCHQRYSLCLLYSYEVRSRRGTGNKATNEKQKLRYKYKREFKVQLLIHSLCQHISKKCKVSIPTLSFALSTSGDQKWLVVGLLFAFDTSYHSVEH